VPEVSIVVPAYNAGQTLAQTLASIMAQTVDDYEVIVVDDGSSDDTAQVAAQAQAQDSRVTVVSTANGGVARARNRGIAETTGSFVAFLDADDLWRPTKLAEQLERFAADPSAGVCVTAATRIDDLSREVDSMRMENTDDTCAALLLRSMVAGCISSGVVRRSLIEAVGGFDPAFSQCADWDLWLRLSRQSRFSLIDEDLVLYRTHSGNMSSNVSLLERDTFAVLDKFFACEASGPYLPLRRRAYSNHWLICSGSYLHARASGDSLRCLANALREDPTNLSRLAGLPRRWCARLTRRFGARR
jgi:glycosyltransferase involved in cell wall biosynthesis